MSSPETAIHFLLVNAHAEEIKLVSSTLRGFFPNCRIEAVYSSDDAITASQESGWHIILVDQDLAPDRGVDILSRLRRNAPYAAVILQTAHSDSDTAVRALQSGIDFLLFKNSPAFLTELVFYVQEAIEKRDLRTKLDQTFQRHLRLVETLSDIFYELDRDGRFVYISPSVTGLLGHTPEELAGRHYSILLSPSQEPLARFRINERRAGSRSVRQYELSLQTKALPDRAPDTISTELTAKGLYDSANRYLGTVGLIKDMSQQKQQEGRLLELESKLRESDRKLALTQEVATVSEGLQQPLIGLLNDSQRLLNTLQHLKIEQALETMAAHAVQASQLTRRLSQAVATQASQFTLLDLNEIIHKTVLAIHDDLETHSTRLSTQLTPGLPAILGTRESLEELVRILISYAQRQLGAATPLLLQTDSVVMHHTSGQQGATVFETARSETYVTLSLRENAVRPSPRTSRQAVDRISAVDFLHAHEIVHNHDGAIEIDSTRSTGLLIKVKIPAASSPVAFTHPTPRTTSPTETTGIATAPSPSVDVEIHPPAADRRRFARRPVDFPIELAIGNSGYPGLIRNISAGGALMTLQDVGSSLHLQPAYLLLKTPVSLLELQGTVFERPAGGKQGQAGKRDLAISFSLPSDHDRIVIDSLLDGALAGSTMLAIEGLIPLPRPAMGSAEEAAQQASQGSRERREAVRLKLAIPIRLNFPEQQTARPLGLIVNLSHSGAAVELPGRPGSIALHQPVQLIPTGAVAQTAGAFPSEQPDHLWTGHIVWVEPIPVNKAAPPNRPGDLPIRIGIRFQELSSPQEQVLQRLLDSGSHTRFDLSEPVADSPIITISKTVLNRQGLSVALCHDVLRHTRTKRLPIIILSPGFGRTQASYVALAYFLAARGMRVVRYDQSNHIGLSEGPAEHATMSSMEDDLDAVLTWVRQQWPESPTTLMAPDLAGRIAVRRSDWHMSLRRLILINPTLDLRGSLERLHHRDVTRDHLNNTRFGIANLMGLNIDIDRFLADALASNLTDFSASRDDLMRCRVDTIFALPPSEWDESPLPSLPAPLVAEALQALGNHGRLVNVSTAILTAADMAPIALRGEWERLWQLCRSSDEPAAAPGQLTLAPTARATAIRYRLERDKVRGKHLTRATTRDDLWATQTKMTSSLDELPAFWQLIDQMYQLAQPVHEGSAILDVGCGVHSFARLLLLNLSYRLRSQAWRQTAPVRYVGVDFSSPVLRTTQAAARETIDHLDVMFSGRISSHPPVRPSWIVSRSIESLPFASGSFERIVANLSISFSPSPLHAVRELFRVLKPGGKLILSSFSLSADLATLYRPHLQELGADEFEGDARVNLSHMARFCECLRTGQLHAFEEDSLISLVDHATRNAATIQRALSGHTLIATVEKPVSAS